jgi:hypothetical protein
MTRLLHFLVVISMLFSATLGAGIDFGGPDCHSHGAKHHERLPIPDGAHGDVLLLRAECDCSCPCCSYVAHLIPLPSTVSIAYPPAPEVLYAGGQASWVSLTISPPIRPPDT